MQADLTFKARVERFWQRYARVAVRFYKMLEEENTQGVLAETEEMMEELLPGCAWVYGPGEAGYGEPGRSLTLSGEASCSGNCSRFIGPVALRGWTGGRFMLRASPALLKCSKTCESISTGRN